MLLERLNWGVAEIDILVRRTAAGHGRWRRGLNGAQEGFGRSPVRFIRIGRRRTIRPSPRRTQGPQHCSSKVDVPVLGIVTRTMGAISSCRTELRPPHRKSSAWRAARREAEQIRRRNSKILGEVTLDIRHFRRNLRCRANPIVISQHDSEIDGFYRPRSHPLNGPDARRRGRIPRSPRCAGGKHSASGSPRNTAPSAPRESLNPRRGAAFPVFSPDIFPYVFPSPFTYPHPIFQSPFLFPLPLLLPCLLSYSHRISFFCFTFCLCCVKTEGPRAARSKSGQGKKAPLLGAGSC